MPNAPTADIEATIADVDAADSGVVDCNADIDAAIALIGENDLEKALEALEGAKGKNTSIRIKIAAAKAKLMAMLLL